MSFAARIIIFAISTLIVFATIESSVGKSVEGEKPRCTTNVKETTETEGETGKESILKQQNSPSLTQGESCEEIQQESFLTDKIENSAAHIEDKKESSYGDNDQRHQMITKLPDNHGEKDQSKNKRDRNDEEITNIGSKRNYNRNEQSDDEFLKLVLESDVDIWSDAYLKTKIKIRLVDKAWKPMGPSSKTDAVMDFYQWNVSTAVESLEGSNPYKYEEQPLDKAELLLLSEKFDKSLPSIMIIHSISDNADAEFVRNTITTLAMRNLNLVYNIFSVDMADLNFNMYSSTMKYYMRESAQFEPIANALGNFFVEASKQNRVIAPDKVHLVGFGYSGLLIGYMGRYIEEKTKNKIASILALDPIGSPNNPYGKPVNKNDAAVVHVYHSNSFPIGTVERRGTADFTFNDGIVQLECKGIKDPWTCSHMQLTHRFWFVILYGGTEKFKGRQCPAYTNFYFGVCNDQPTAFLTYPIRESNTKGSFFLKTSDKPPYGLGDAGNTAEPGTKNRLLKYVDKNKNTAEAPKIDRELFQMMLIS